MRTTPAKTLRIINARVMVIGADNGRDAFYDLNAATFKLEGKSAVFRYRAPDNTGARSVERILITPIEGTIIEAEVVSPTPVLRARRR